MPAEDGNAFPDAVALAVLSRCVSDGPAVYFSLQPQLIPRRSRQLRELVNCNAGNNSLGDLARVLVMGQINHLASACHLTKQPENLLGPETVEGLHDVVGNE
ncbi:hypothetical protein [Mesorhizobium sp. M0684]|uniref:hypothetical protein n=1 Tax=unclassified Mesorhizobium TaxID=325217 RepID=UPI00333853DC